MSKAILVMDMPEDCEDCPLFEEKVYNPHNCKAKRKNVDKYTYYKNKPDWCPLRPMPEKKQNACTHGFAGGWNACIDAIGGGDGD